MNWRKIVFYSAVLLAVRVSLGLLEGLIFPGHISILWGMFASFVATALLFAHFRARQATNPVTHAFTILAINFAADLAINYATSPSSELPMAFLAFSWVVLLLGASLGCLVGIVFSKRRKLPDTR